MNKYMLNKLLNIINIDVIKYNSRKLSLKTVIKGNESKSRMQAWQIHSYGDIKELQLSKARLPIIEHPSELLVRVEAASLNPIDHMMMTGYGKNILSIFRQCELEFPLTLGRDFSGVIVDKGQNVDEKYQIGDSVYGVVPLHKPGSHAEAVIVNEALIRHKPENLSHVEASSILYAALTAWSALYITGELLLRNPRTSKILVLGASGGVGTVAVQMLKSQKATVIGTCSANAIPLVQSLGADNVFDYSDAHFSSNVAEQGNYDIILDCAQYGIQNIPQYWKYNKFITLNSPLLKNTDKYGIFGGLAASVGDLFMSNVSKCNGGKSVRWGFFAPSTDGLVFIDNLVKKEKILPVLHKVFKFSEMLLAYETLSAGHLRGKIVIDFNETN